MGVELPLFSFFSTFLLILILPAIHYYSIPSASIIAWLFCCNLIHGINSILWFGNQGVHAPAWCDICKGFVRGIDNLLILSIASVVLLGAMVALPGCFLCIARRLEAITTRRDSEQRQGKTYETAFETATCFLVPTLYMGLRALHRCLVAKITRLIPAQTQLFRIVASLYLRTSAVRQQLAILSPAWLLFGFHPSVSP
jgi:pheromone a factor receptor